MNFGQRLLDILDEKNMTRAELCRLTGLKSSNLVSYIKDPNRSPKLSTAVKIADALGVSLDYLSDSNDPQESTYIDAQKSRLLDGFSKLNAEGRSDVIDYVEFQLSKNSKNEDIQGDQVSGVA